MKAFVISLISLLACIVTIVLTGCRGAYIALFSIGLMFLAASWHVVNKDF
jgi:O-antigen ligase